MDKLEECIQAYEKLINKNYILILENNVKIELTFQAKSFHHLLGLQYLTDIPQVQKNLPYQTTARIYKNIKNKYITYSTLEKSPLFKEINSRVNYFPLIGEILDHVREYKVIIDFDHTKVKQTTLKSEYILYKPFELGYLHLCLAHDPLDRPEIYYPESFFYEPSKYYTNDQNFIDVLDVEVIQFGKKKKT